MGKLTSEVQLWQQWQMIMANLRWQPLQIAQGSTMTPWHSSESSKSDNLPHAVKCNVPLHTGVFLFVVHRCFPLCCHEICWEHFQSWGDEEQESSVNCDPSASSNSCLQHQSMWLPLSHVTSLPLSANGSAIQFHRSALRGRQCWRRNENLCFNKDKKLFEVFGWVAVRGEQRDGLKN